MGAPCAATFCVERWEDEPGRRRAQGESLTGPGCSLRSGPRAELASPSPIPDARLVANSFPDRLMPGRPGGRAEATDSSKPSCATYENNDGATATQADTNERTRPACSVIRAPAPATKPSDYVDGTCVPAQWEVAATMLKEHELIGALVGYML